MLEPFREVAEPMGAPAEGVTLLPKKRGGYQQIEVMVREKMSQYSTRLALAHELYHCYQYLVNCEPEEENVYKVSEVMVKALKERKGRKRETD